MKSNSREVLFGFIIFISFLLISVIFYAYQIFYTPNFQVGKKEVVFYIHRDTDFKEVLRSLKKDTIIHDPMSFAFVSRLLNYQDHVKPGRYLIKKNMNNLALVRTLRAGLQHPVKVTFNNIRIKQEFAKKIANYLDFKENELLQLLKDSSITLKYGFDTTNILSMFIPNTYEFYWTTSPEVFIKRMHQEYQKFWNKTRTSKAKSLGLSLQQVSVLASIVQAESNMSQEKPRIAGVYINRLQKRMKLEADPTLVFALGDFSLKRVLNRHKQIESPYNTYQNEGLPPGPINMPSIQSIDAVLNYEKHDYIFFCVKEDLSGSHNFAATYEEHQKNARLLHAALDLKGIR
ncbi:MAG: endolytic transglycosylase MltG [Microscillaceae bacterium]|nr:endolytic transglycosylase MltG [Microscillaceae bacterium]